MEKFWHRAIYSQLRCEPEEHRFILTEPPMNTPENREQMAEIMFETFNVKGLFIGVQATLALYAQISDLKSEGAMSKGDLTGTVIDSGDGVTNVFPVSDGFVIGSCVRHIPLAGKDITRFVLQQLKDRGEVFPTEDAMEVAQKIKERYGYVCKDVVSEYKKFDTKTLDEASGKIIQSNKFKKYTHKNSLTGVSSQIDVGYESFLGPEMFFHPEFIHGDWRRPLDEIVDNAIQSCPVDTRRKLYENIVLSGGSTLFKDFDKRLNKNIQTRVDDRFKTYETLTGQAPKPLKVTVAQNMVQRYAVWFVGSVLGSSDHLPKICHSREEYMERGPSICRHNPLFPQGF